MAGESRRQLILEELKRRLGTILTENEFQTNVGQKVYFGELPKLGPHDADGAVALIPMEDQVDDAQVGKVSIVLPVNMVAVAKPSLSEPWVIVEQIIADIKKAIESGDRSLGGLLAAGKNNTEGLMRGSTETAPRNSGSEVVAAMVTYGCHYREAWGDPAA